MLKQGLQKISTCSSLSCFFIIPIGSNDEKLVTFTFGPQLAYKVQIPRKIKKWFNEK